MADTKTTALTELTAPALTDLVYAVATPGGTPASRKLVLSTLQQLIMLDGWVGANETWTYASADAPTFTFTISGDKTGKYSAGMRLKLTQTTVKYFIITAVSYGAPNTTVTIYGGTDYTLTNAAISANYYSMSKAPQGFPLDPTKWTVRVTDTNFRTQATPTQNTWYNLGSNTISIPIGAWHVLYQCCLTVNRAAAGSIAGTSTLSTANNTESDVDFSADMSVLNTTQAGTTSYRSKVLVLAAKTAYYLNVRTTQTSQSNLFLAGSASTTIIEALCAYL